MNCKLMIDGALSKLHQHPFDDRVLTKGTRTVVCANCQEIPSKADVRRPLQARYQLARHARSQAGRMPLWADPQGAGLRVRPRPPRTNPNQATRPEAPSTDSVHPSESSHVSGSSWIFRYTHASPVRDAVTQSISCRAISKCYRAAHRRAIIDVTEAGAFLRGRGAAAGAVLARAGAPPRVEGTSPRR